MLIPKFYKKTGTVDEGEKIPQEGVLKYTMTKKMREPLRTVELESSSLIGGRSAPRDIESEIVLKAREKKTDTKNTC